MREYRFFQLSDDLVKAIPVHEPTIDEQKVFYSADILVRNAKITADYWKQLRAENVGLQDKINQLKELKRGMEVDHAAKLVEVYKNEKRLKDEITSKHNYIMQLQKEVEDLKLKISKKKRVR